MTSRDNTSYNYHLQKLQKVHQKYGKLIRFPVFNGVVYSLDIKNGRGCILPIKQNSMIEQYKKLFDPETFLAGLPNASYMVSFGSFAFVLPLSVTELLQIARYDGEAFGAMTYGIHYFMVLPKLVPDDTERLRYH